MEEKIRELFEEFAEAKALNRIRKEVEETSREVEVKRKGEVRTETHRGKSQFVLDSIHDVLPPGTHLDCKNAESPCLLALLDEYMTADFSPVVIDSLEKLLPALYPNKTIT